MPDENPEDQVNSDFIAAGHGQEFNGQLLQPWSPDRKIAAQCMGMLYPWIGEAGAEQLESTGLYAGALRDTIIFIWLCSTKEHSAILRAQRKPAEAFEKATAFATAAGIEDLTSREFLAAYNAFNEKMAAEQLAKTAPKPVTGSEGSTRPKAQPKAKSKAPRSGPKI